jgi:AcrR family transcriptional regulator
MARRNTHSLEEIREMVLDAAETIIANDGYSALTVRKIAMDIGYTVGSIYMVFASMADLALHIKANTVDELTWHLQQVQGFPPEQQIAELAKVYLQFASQNFNRWTMVFVPETKAPDWYRQKTKQIFAPLEAQIARLAPDSSTQQRQQAARALWSGIHGICALSLTGELDAEDIGEVENDILLLVESFIGGWLASLCSKHYQ